MSTKSNLIALIESVESEALLQKISLLVEEAIAPEPSPELVAELQRISDAYDRNPTSFKPYQEVLAEIRAELTERRKNKSA